MSGNTLWKLLITIAVLTWSVLNLIPFADQDFEVFLGQQVRANQEGFVEVLTEAKKLVDNDQAPSLFIALKDWSKDNRANLAQYFPQINLSDVKNLDQRNDLLLNHLLNLSRGKLKLGLDLQGGVSFTLKMDPNAIDDVGSYERQQRMQKAIDIMSNRVNGLGVTEPIIRAVDVGQIEIQLPGVSTKENPDALAALQKPAKLTFHQVNRDQFPSSSSEEDVPIGYNLMEMEHIDQRSGEIFTSNLFVKRVPDLTGGAVKNAFVNVGQYGNYEIMLQFTKAGAKRFAEITRRMEETNKSAPYANLSENDPRRYARLAIVLDGKLYSAPRVEKEIPGGNASISGSFTQREAFDLANVLNNPLEYELTVDEMYEVGPTLAEDAREASIKAAAIGAGFVVLFMLLYYLLPGVIAVIAVAANILIVLGVLASLGATLTLPGVAALVLTVGMAVDANILIFERIREELNAGKSTKAALQAGFDKVFSTIIDANITTLLTAAILIWLGTGPIKGFGVTLAIGICATVFCALILNRMLLELFVRYKLVKKLLHYGLFRDSHIDFMQFRRPAFFCSWVVVVAGLVVIGIKGKAIYGIDFVGGEELVLEFTEKPPTTEIYDLADNEDLGEVSLVFQKVMGEEKERLRLQTESGQGKALLAVMQEAFPQSQLTLVEERQIGASVSQNIQWNALLSIGVAVLGILLYVGLRFEVGYGAGAVVSTVHDILMTIGLFVMFGGQFTAPMVAALLMIVGYSINDTIVVFDRIREELVLDPRATLRSIVNLSINKTLARTLLTSLTTLLAALALYIFGAGEINDFAFVFIIGIVTGTFSSIFIASPVFYWWHKGDRRRVEERDPGPKREWPGSPQKKSS